MIEIHTDTIPASARGGVVSIGNFDGVHLGHRQIIGRLRERARSLDVPSVVFTFHPHPIAILRPNQVPPALTTIPRRLELLRKSGVEIVIVYPTNRSFLELSPDQFFQEIVCKKMNALGLIEGPNFFYGADRKGNGETLRASCERAGIFLEITEPVCVAGRLVSSSSIRSAILEGDMPGACELLGDRYEIQGRVVEGARRGRELGIPTANLEGIETLLPPEGVYAGVGIYRETRYPAAINLGPNPTFGESKRKFEAHLLDFTGDLYGEILRIELHQRLRETKPFQHLDELKQQLARDLEETRKVFLGQL